MMTARVLISLGLLHRVAAFAAMNRGHCNYVPSTRRRRASEIASSAECTDLPGWISTTGETCAQYTEAKNWCTAEGGYGTGWKRSWGTFAQNSNAKGDSAAQSCCTCGGGIRAVQGKGGQGVSASPTPAPTPASACAGLQAYDKTSCACSGDKYATADRQLAAGGNAGGNATATICASICSRNDQCTGFEIRPRSYCYLWLNNACSSTTAPGWATGFSKCTYVMKPACKQASGRAALHTNPAPPTRRPTRRPTTFCQQYRTCSDARGRSACAAATRECSCSWNGRSCTGRIRDPHVCDNGACS